MLSNPTSSRPSPMITCSGTGLCHNPIHLRLGRVGFRPRSYPYSCRLSRINRPNSISKETVNNTPKQVSDEVLEGLSCEEDKSLVREEEKKIRQHIDGMSAQGLKNMNEFADCLSKEEIKKLRVIIKGLSEEEMEKVRKFADDLTEEENKNFIKVLNVTSERERIFFINFMRRYFLKEEKVIISVAVLFWKDMMTENKFKDQIDVLRRMCYTSRRFGVFKNVLLSVVPQLLSGALVYAVMKQSPLVTAAFMQKHFYLFTLLLTGGLRLPTLKAFKDKFPIQKNWILNTILHVAIAAFGVLLADVHIAKSNGIIILAALFSTLIMFILQICIACQLIVVENKDLSYFESKSDSDSVVIRAIIASFIQIINPGPITAAIDTGFNYLIFLSPVVSNIGMILKGGFYNDDDCSAAAANLFWGLYDLFISLMKAMAMLSGFLIISGKGLGMLFGLFIKAMSMLFGLIVS